MAYAQRHFQARADQGRTQKTGTDQAPHHSPDASGRHRVCGLAHLPDTKHFPYSCIIDLYYRRWGVENHYRDEKVSFEVERFHSKTANGIQQELFAILIVCVIARTITALSVPSEAVETAQCSKAPQLKNAAKSVAREAALLVASDPDRAFAIFQELLDDIRRVNYYKPKIPKPSKPRINKGAVNKWQEGRSKKTVLEV